MMCVGWRVVGALATWAVHAAIMSERLERLAKDDMFGWWLALMDRSARGR